MYIPIVFHNLSGYDAQLFIRELGKKFDKGEIGVVAENKEKYISFNVDVIVDEYVNELSKVKEKKIQLRFIDSIRFMASSLDSLMNNLVKGGRKLSGFEDYSKEQYKLLIRKGVYPYEYMSSWDKFKETQLPFKEAFYSKLYMSDISDKDYEHAQRVWKGFGMKNLGKYHDLYLKTDVLLLSNVSESFRNECLNHHKLDPAHFYTTPGLAWQTALKKMGVKLELLTDPDMLLMFEKGIQGAITQAVHRYVKTNNKYMGKKLNPEENTSFLQYLDANNLYGWAMNQPLPTGGFKWVNDVTPDEIGKLVKLENKDYLLEADVKYPKELHDSHNDLPFMCEKMKINKVEKLVPNLYDKEKYVIHLRALTQALEHGLVLENVHCVIEFNQSASLKPYIDFNTELRMKAKNNFEKDFFKLMNNAVFGKTMENIRKHKDIELVTNEKAYLRNVMKPNFKSGVLFDENLMGCEMGKIKVVMNKHVYLGQAILDLSKIIMYEFHYDYMKPKYGNNLTLCYMDTDSLVYNIKTEDFYEDIAQDEEMKFDTSSGYSKEDSRPLPIELNKKVIGLMKDEIGGKKMTEFVTLRPKLYAYRKLDGVEDKKCKGIRKCVVKKTLDFDDYKKCLFNSVGKSAYRSQLMFGNRNHEVHTVEVNKVALNRDDDKQIAKKDGVSTLAWGHKLLCWNHLLSEVPGKFVTGDPNLKR